MDGAETRDGRTPGTGNLSSERSPIPSERSRRPPEVARSARPYLALVALVSAAAALTLGLGRWLSAPGYADSAIADPVDRVCRDAPSATRAAAIPAAAVLFDGAFARRPPEAEAEVRRWLHTFTGSFQDRFRVFLGRAAAHDSLVQAALARYEIPEDFLYLAVIESGMNPRATSRAGAVGIWQFMEGTAREEGLEVGWAVDERRDPVASTEAAARHLRRLHDRFGDWGLAVAAYNSGAYRVRRALRRAGPGADFWELSRRRLLPRETRDYVPKLLAAARIGRDPVGTAFGFVPRFERPRYRAVEVDPASRLDVIAAAAGIPLERLRSLNPHFTGQITDPLRPSSVRLPPESVRRFRVRYARIPAERRRGGVVHVVRRHETLGRIAREYGVSVRRLRAANGEIQPRRLQIGTRLTVPTGSGDG